MAWLKVDDKRALHKKFRRRGFAARGLDEAAMCLCAHDETDGFVSDADLEDLAHHHGITVKAATTLAAELCQMDRWRRDEGKGGWWIKDYLHYNPSHADLEAQRQARRKAGRLGGVRSGESRRARSRDEASASTDGGSEP